MDARKAKPGAGGRRASRVHRNRIEYGKPTTSRLPSNWRDRLPDAGTYYAAHVVKLGKPNDKGWAACRCPFHNDKNPSASANLSTGGFKCHVAGCEATHDMIGFHMQLRNLAFADAVRELIEGAR